MGQRQSRPGLYGPAPNAKDPADYRSVFLTADAVYPQYMYFASNKNENDKKGDNYDLFVTFRNSAETNLLRPKWLRWTLRPTN